MVTLAHCIEWPQSVCFMCVSDPSLRELVKRILPMCSNYSIVVRFIEGTSSTLHTDRTTVIYVPQKSTFSLGIISR